MTVVNISASLATSLSHFLANPRKVIQIGGGDAIAVLDDNQPCFYVLSPEAWAVLQQAGVRSLSASPGKGGVMPVAAEASAVRLADGVRDSYEWLAEQLLQSESQRVERGELSAAALGILRNRLRAHVMPYFRDVLPSDTGPATLDGFLERLTSAGLSTTTMSQYLVVVRKLLKLAVKHKLLREIPEMPKVSVVHRPRAMLTLGEYAAVVRAAHRLSRTQQTAPQVKLEGHERERFWVAPKHLILPRDMAWVMRFMVNSFVRPGDLRQLKHKHVQVCRGEHLYLRLTLPETKRHDAAMVTLRPAVQIYEALREQALSQGYGRPDDHVFLPGERDREYALAILGFWFKWVM